jgi:hypothetical protein
MDRIGEDPDANRMDRTRPAGYGLELTGTHPIGLERQESDWNRQARTWNGRDWQAMERLGVEPMRSGRTGVAVARKDRIGGDRV